jgi:hypothetical protein
MQSPSESSIGVGFSESQDPLNFLEAVTNSVEKVDSLFHLASFMITHPYYLEYAGKLLKLQLPMWLRRKAAPLGASVKPHNIIEHASATILHVMVFLLFLQIIGLYSFIIAQSEPQCKSDSDCPPTTFCSTGRLTYVLNGAPSACFACAGVLDWTFNRLPLEAAHHIYSNRTNLPDISRIENCQKAYYDNDTGDSWTSIVAIALVAGTIGAYLAKVSSCVPGVV